MNLRGPEHEGHNPPPITPDVAGEDIASIGDHPGDGPLALFRNLHFLEGRPKIDIPAFMRSFRKATNFRELDSDLVVIRDPVGLNRILPDGTVETYEQKMAKERQKGRDEAVSYGVGTIGKNQFIGIIFNWEFMAGTSGVVAGEKFIRAKNLAIQANMPMIVVCASGGQRQQEGVAALREMKRTVHALNQFKKKTNQPLVFVLVGNVWGGLTASGVPLADLVIGVENSDMGFAGRGIIGAYEGKEPPAEAQTVENSFETNRAVHVILKNQKELLDYLKRKLDITANTDQPPAKPKHHREITGINFDHNGFHIPFRPDRVLRSHRRADLPMVFIPIQPETVWDQHRVLSGDLRRPDTLYILQHTFDGYLPLFSGKVTSERDGSGYLRYPPIVAALAYIDDPRLSKRLMRMVIGNQPSYIQRPDGKILIDQFHSNPTAWDYQYELAEVSYAERLRYQITTFVHTFGARPKIEDELAAQFRGIAYGLKAQLEFPCFTSGYLIGVGGSGGHLALDFTADYAAMLGGGPDFPEGGAQEYVAEPRAAAEILHRNPTREDIIRTAEGMKPTATFLAERGLIDRIIREPKGGAQNNPLATTLAIREDIIRVELEFGHLTSDQILARRIQRVETSQPIPIGRLSGKLSDDHRSFLKRLLRR